MLDSNILQHLKDNWIFYLFVGQMIFSVAITGTRLSQAETRLGNLEIYQEKNQTTLTDIKARLASIDTNLEYLKRK